MMMSSHRNIFKNGRKYYGSEIVHRTGTMNSVPGAKNQNFIFNRNKDYGPVSSYCDFPPVPL